MRLTQVTVSGLFDRFDHTIRLNQEDRITIVLGPNGSGKTMILRLINALFTKSISTIKRLPFRHLQLDFDDHSILTVARIGEPARKADQPRLEIAIQRGGQRRLLTQLPHVKADQLGVPLGAIEEFVPNLDQIGPDLWRERDSGESLGLDEVVDRYGEFLPSPSVAPSKGKGAGRDDLEELRAAIPVRFINTERLYTPVPRKGLAYRHGPIPQPVPAVRRYSDELGERIKQTLAAYGTLSQSLDRSFPARLVAEPTTSAMSMEEIRRDLEASEAKRARLVKAGVLTEDPGWGLSYTGQLDVADPTKLSVLSVYVRDAQTKLAVFDDVFQRVDLFQQILNARFRHKRIQVHQAGFRVHNADGTVLNADLLSSGEQHEIVLLYELLFRTRDGSLILIDEPEISLHVAWQDAFLTDITQVVKVSQFDALIATHSPQIVDGRDDLAVVLDTESDLAR